MAKVFIDADFICHTSAGEGLKVIETDFFDGKCDAYIEGYRYVPEGETWTRPDGVSFVGIMISPWKPWEELDALQRKYERELLSQLQSENASLIDDMASMVEEVYNSDTEMMGI